VPCVAVLLAQTALSASVSEMIIMPELLEAELELLELELLLELEELLDELELLLDELLGAFASSQNGSIKLPSWVPWKPNAFANVMPGAGS
jgi:hypothetical protein